MEPIFSNSCNYTVANLEEMAKANTPTWYKLYCIIFSILFVVIAIVSFTMKHAGVAVLFFIFAIALFFIFKKSASITAKRTYNQNAQTFDGELQTRIFFYDASIVGKNLKSSGVVNTTYDKISEVIETEHLFIINIEKDLSILVDKSGFLSDNQDNFPAFIKEKCVNADFSFLK